MSTRAKRRRRIAGFTLVEALLATALMGVILAAIATVTAQWLPNWNRGFERVQRIELLALGLERIVADLAAAEFVTAGANIRQPVFDGTELSVTFLRTALGPNTRPGLELVRIAEIGSDKGLTTVRTRARFLPMGRDGIEVQARPGDPVVLVRAPYRVTFSYAGPDRVWRNVWRGRAQLPKAIRVQVRDAATDRTLSVSTATVVHAEMPADCVLAEVIADCLNRPDQPRATVGLTHAGTPHAAPAPHRPQDGFIIVAVLWILAALATLATIIAVYVINTATAFAVHDERLQAEALTRAAIELSLYNIVRDAEQPASAAASRSAWGTPTSRSSSIPRWRASISTPRRRQLLAGLFAGLGAPRAGGRLLCGPHHRMALAARARTCRTRARSIAPPGLPIRRAARRSSMSRNSGS